jgi:peptidoglycan/xylan/chitin deacetylase (PgdA/CDA1 family)
MSRLAAMRRRAWLVVLLFLAGATATEALPREVRVAWSGPAARRVALTFDDGPHATFTPAILDLLAASGARATFFVVGRRVEQSGAAGRAILNRMITEGHEIGNHSWSHAIASRLSRAALHAEIERTQEIVRQATGFSPRLFRPPGGGMDFTAVRSLAATEMEIVVMWSIDPLDWTKPGRERIWSRVGDAAAPGSIILLHDIHEETVKALPLLIDLLQAKGYELVTVSELLR